MRTNTRLRSLTRLLPLPLRLPLLGILLLGFALRTYRLAGGSIWWDEGWTAWLARQAPGEIAAITAADVHPPLSYWLLSGWRFLLGDSEFALRLLSVFAGFLTVVAAYLLARAVAGRLAALLAALVLALSLFDISWSQEIRMYALAALWGGLALWATAHLWRRPRLRWWLLYVLFMAAGLYTLYLFALVLVVANVAALLWLVRRPRPWRATRDWALAQLAVLALYTPWLLYAFQRIRRDSTATPLAPFSFLKIYWTVLTVGSPVSVEQFTLYTVAMLLLFVGLLLLLFLRTRDKPWRQNTLLLLVLGVALPATIIYLVSLPGNPFFYAPRFAPRYLIIFVVAYAVLLGWGIAALARRPGWPLALPALLIVGSAALVGMGDYYRGRVRQDDYQSLVNTLSAYHRPDDGVLLLTDKDWPIFAYYYDAPWRGISDRWEDTPEQVETFLDPLWSGHDGLWLVSTQYAPQADPGGLYAGWLEARAVAHTTYDFGDKTLAFYARRPERAELIRQPARVVGQPVSLDAPGPPELFAFDLPVPVYESGASVRLALYWRGAGTETVTVRLVDDNGQPWRETVDEITLDGSGPLRRQVTMVVPPEAPSGSYRLTVQLSGQEPQPLATLQVQAEERAILTRQDVEIGYPADYTFANGAHLLGYDLPRAEVSPGGTLPLTLYWQATRPLEERYKVFTHLEAPPPEGEGIVVWGQQDNEPGGGDRPMPLWQPGEIIVDEYAIPVNPEAPPGDHALTIGLYHPVTGERVAVQQGDTPLGGQLTLATVRVRPAD